MLLCAHRRRSDWCWRRWKPGPRDIPQQQIAVRVRGVQPLAPDTLLLHLQTPRSNRLRFLAGQRVTLGAAPAAARRTATYPMASCPCDDRNLHFHVARDAGDAFAAAALRRRARGRRCGDAVGAVGRVRARRTSARPLVFVACDTGFAPIKSLIEHAMARRRAPSRSRSTGWRTRPDGHYLANQCRAWAEALDDFRYAAHTAADPESGAAAIVANLGGALRLDGRDVYVAGPAAFVAATVARLEVAGVPPRQVRAAAV